jgi:hypothetical protein
MDLDTQGRLLLRVSMEGEKDDIQFYFGRAFRALKRSENDMTRRIVETVCDKTTSLIADDDLLSTLSFNFNYPTTADDDLGTEVLELVESNETDGGAGQARSH